MQTYLDQVGEILDVHKIEVRKNSEWIDQITFQETLLLLSKFTLSQILERGLFKERQEKKEPVWLYELLYPVLQAYDSVKVRADIEVAGKEQLINLNFGRDLQPHFKQDPQDLLGTSMLVGIDGKKKMSKSEGNFVGITESPKSMIGKLMTVPDTAILDYARLAAGWPEEKVKELSRRLGKENPRDIKLEVAQGVVRLYHGAEAAKRAADEWLRVFHQKGLPSDIPEKQLAGTWEDVAELLVKAGLATSKSESRRLVEFGGVRLNGHDIRPALIGKENILTLDSGDLLQVGKRKFVRVG
ncbi:MAG: tyrosyl-tRNA synthetase [Parcubacteria group bacterium Gr01-1014_38]|nr:MAG: tyrosyl-tRNA synthetase [Parcubacteria group bacterium Gr01-1014_38]